MSEVPTTLPLTPEEQLRATQGSLTPADAAQVIAQPVKKKKPANFMGKDGKGKFRPGPKMRAAINEVQMRVTAHLKPEYREVAEKHGVNKGSLETLVRRHKKGQLDMEAPANAEQKREIDLRVELEKSLRLLGRYERLLNNSLESLLKKAEAEYKEGNFLAFDQLQIDKVISQLGAAGSLRAKKEKGVLEILGQLMELQKIRETAETQKEMQMAKGTVIVEQAPKLNQAGAAAIIQHGAHLTIRTVLSAKTAEESPQK